MKYLVTGATGFVGGEVARQLRAKGHDVIAVVRSPERAQNLAALGIQLAKGDVIDKESMRAPMQGVDGVYHIAGWYKIGVKDKRDGQKVNVDGTRNVLELMRELGVPKGVYTSTLAVNSDTHGKVVDETYQFQGTHISEYDRTKAEAHKIAEQFIAGGLPLVIVMPGVVYGPGDTSAMGATLRQYLQRKLPMIPQGTAFSWGYIEDIAWAHIAAMDKGRSGQSYMISGPTHTLVEAMQMAQEITGIPAPRSVPPWMMSSLAPVMGLVENVVTLPETYTAEGLRVTAGTTYIGDNTKARRELGYNPRPLKEGLTQTLQYELATMGK